MLTLIVRRRINSLIRNSTTHPEKIVRYTQEKWGIIFAEYASNLSTVILHRCGVKKNSETVMSVSDNQA